MKKILTLLLILSVLLSIVSCAATQSTGENGDSSAKNGDDTSLRYDPNGMLMDNLPADLDFDGEDARFIYPSENLNEFFSEDVGSDIVSQAVYKMNLAVMERLKVKLKCTTIQGVDSPAVRDSYAATIVNTYTVGDDQWDFVGEHIGAMSSVILSGAFQNLTSLKYTDFDMPWWMSDLVENATVGGKLYLAAGDASISLLKNTTCLLYNKNVAEDYGIEDLQKLAIRGGFTKEKLLQYTLLAHSSLDSKPDISRDTFGFAILNDNHVEAFKAAFNYPILKKNNGGEYEFNYDCQRASDACSWLVDFTNSNDSVYISRNTADVNAAKNAFREDRLLFVTATFSFAVDVFKDINGSFNVLPLPKWSEGENYSTLPRGIYIAFGVMRLTNNAEMAGAVLEAFASEGYRKVTPVYFEDALKIKYTDATNETAAVFDIIRNSVSFDFGYTFSYSFGFDAAIKTAIYNNLPYWTSMVNSGKKAFMSKYDSFFETLSNLEA
ncbi:MAG: hypothetical protein IJU75_06205 [Clostridia bacterium]|nr:hypothetical protein [Clostridia bacterium]